MLALGALGSGLAYVLNFRVIAAAGASTASAVTYLTPVVAVAVGLAFLDERVTANQVLGALIVLVGIAPTPGPPPPPDPAGHEGGDELGPVTRCRTI